MQTRVSVRNLRIREDTAKYLRNLDVRSAYYDPKTRSMRSNPNPEKNPHELDYAVRPYICMSSGVCGGGGAGGHIPLEYISER